MKSPRDDTKPDQAQLESDDPRRTSRNEESLQRIGAALHGLRYGSVLAIVQDGVVVQIERTEKTRLGR
jgi:hypothetical protein